MTIYIIMMALLGIGFAATRFLFKNEMKSYFDERIYMASGLVLAAGMFVHNSAVFNILAGTAIFLIAKSRVDALCRLVILVAIIPSVSFFVNGFGVYIMDVSTADSLSIGALLACLSRPNPRKMRGFGAEDAVVFVLILIFSLCSTRHANFTGQSRELISNISGLALPYFLFSRFISNQSEYGKVVGGLAGASLILAVVAIYEARFHWSIYYTIFSNQSDFGVMSHSLRVRSGFMRTPTSFNESTSFAVFQLVGLLAVIASKNLFKNKILWFAAMVLSGLGLLLAQSRGADLSFLAAIFVLQIVRRRYALAAASVAAGGVLVATLLMLAHSSSKVASFLGSGEKFNGGGDYRQELLQRGLQVGMTHPIFGDGMDVVTLKMADITQGEGIIDFVNTYLTIFLTSGVVGLSIFLMLICFVVVKIFHKKNSSSSEIYVRQVQQFVATALVAELIALIFTSFYERNPYWLMVSLAGAKILSNYKSALAKVSNGKRIGNFSYAAMEN